MDPLGRRYIHRPIFYNTLLSRIVRTASKLMDVFNDLNSLQGNRESTNEESEFKDNVHSALARIVDGFELLEVITIDIDTLLYRDYDEIEVMYEKFLDQLLKEKTRLESEQQQDSKKIEEVNKHLKELKEEHADIKAEEKEEEILKEDLDKLHVQYGDLGELIESFGQETHSFINTLHHITAHADLVAKADIRDVVNPEISIQELSMKGNFRLLRLIKRNAIEIRQLHNNTEELRSTLDVLKGRMKSFNETMFEETNEELQELKDDETKLLTDSGMIGHYEQVLLHRLLHSFLHRIDAEKDIHEKFFPIVKKEIRDTHNEAQVILDRIRTQTKKLKNEITN